jgi:hypothetical protein
MFPQSTQISTVARTHLSTPPSPKPIISSSLRLFPEACLENLFPSSSSSPSLSSCPPSLIRPKRSLPPVPDLADLPPDPAGPKGDGLPGAVAIRNAGRAASGADDVSRELGAEDCGDCGRVGGLTVNDTGVDMLATLTRGNQKVTR